MNDMIVGMENLPNVFFEKIQIYKTDVGIKVVVIVSLYDHKENPSWYNRNLGLKIKVLFESRLEQIQLLNDGLTSLYDAQPEVPRRLITSGLNTPTPTGLQGDYEKYTIKFERTLLEKPTLNVYAACFIDGLNFGNPMFDKFYGPMAAEQIYVGGEVNTLSNYFYYPDTNEEYGGPVHQKPDGSFMEGSEHSDKPHKDVVLVTEENYKIVSYNFDSDNEDGLPPPNLPIAIGITRIDS